MKSERDFDDSMFSNSLVLMTEFDRATSIKGNISFKFNIKNIFRNNFKQVGNYFRRLEL